MIYTDRKPVAAVVALDWNGGVCLLIGDGPKALRVSLRMLEIGAQGEDRAKIEALRALVQNSAGSAEPPAT